MKEKIDEVLQDVNKLPAISSVVTKVLQMVQNPDVKIQELSEEISKDPAITASVIKLSNSAYYRASKPIRTVSEALMTLGTKTVKEIILLTAAKGILKKDLPGYQIEGDQMWLQSILVAELASRIVAHKKINLGKDLVFTAGLLCNVGKIVLAQFFQPLLFKLKAEIEESNEPFPVIEKKYLGYTHMEISEKLLRNWNFPEDLIDVVANYTNPENAKLVPLLVSVIHIAYAICIVSGIGIDIGGISIPISPIALEQTGITDKDIEMYFMKIPEIEKHLTDLLTT
ncbi:HDOD domain-containing protein [Leptospira sp. GIMC2001]|uniref:HDOD domain-containing protein n=1 Tax=Leptospira sp. GIMC2001 TaxID=1513297 RepID=UPI0023494647|nr:HDOD domain-containing protein [Leptospira sp. GIMC2001]WCL47627.1 HDOD domain-containing protein [Leptospira sp. GIMC2001]